MRKSWEIKEIESICEINYGTRVVNKRDGGAIYPVYGGGGATFYMDTYNREDCFVVARFAMSKQCTRFVSGKFFLNDSGLSVTPKNENILLQNFIDMQLLYLKSGAIMLLYFFPESSAAVFLSFSKSSRYFKNKIHDVCST